ncbi:AAA family ATPase [Methylobacterium sp. J-030]|uniref:ATP-binding protein n=1 Tax=Methylobacterium sp. J-030 TaxID=2836627 RepID=UPI001FBA9F2E|nr:AAA family ATPase [Methylobacterium sp. J-030]MCJ2068156.1 AAA family ATPase [Methylobacterium sp. J-030]
MSERAFNGSSLDDSDRFHGWPGPDPDAVPRSKGRDNVPPHSRTGISIRWHGDADPNADRAWLVRDIVFETGKGLLAGVWGGGKTFGALDLSASVMTGSPFAGKRVMRQGGVLFIAPEGSFEIPIRLRGIVQGKLGPDAPDRLPFAWIEECPRLLDADAVPQLATVAKMAAEHLAKVFDLPLALIVIDTVAAGAGFTDENSAAETQRVMNAMEALSHQTGAFVLGVDHFGKAVETGTRGSSAKEAAADVVLAMLASRDEAGTISNTRMAIRKVRGGRCGYEIPYSLEVITVGETYDREPITTCIVNWQTDQISATAVTAAKERWPTSLKVFREALLASLVDHGSRAWPFGSEGAEVRAVPLQTVRTAFSTIYPADGDDDAKRAEAKRKAFKRAVETCLGRSLIGSVAIGGIDHLWLKPDTD